MLRNPLPPAIPALLVPSLGPSSVTGQAVELQVGQTLQGTLAPGDTAEYAVEIGDDSFVFGEVDQVSVDVVLRILGPPIHARLLSGDRRRHHGAEQLATFAPFDPEAYEPEDFDAYVGRYELDAAPGVFLRFFREADTLFTQVTGQQRVEIVPRSDSTFALTAVPATITFRRDEEGGVEGLTLDQGGQEQHATMPRGRQVADVIAGRA